MYCGSFFFPILIFWDHYHDLDDNIDLPSHRGPEVTLFPALSPLLLFPCCCCPFLITFCPKKETSCQITEMLSSQLRRSLLLLVKKSSCRRLPSFASRSRRPIVFSHTIRETLPCSFHYHYHQSGHNRFLLFLDREDHDLGSDHGRIPSCIYSH
jgi:hypothetical protein